VAASPIGTALFDADLAACSRSQAEVTGMDLSGTSLEARGWFRSEMVKADLDGFPWCPDEADSL